MAGMPSPIRRRQSLPTRQTPATHQTPLRVMRWWPITTVVVLVVVLGGVSAMWLLGVWAPIPSGVAEPEQLRLDRIKTALTVAAGLAAGVTLLLTLRRQVLSERAQRFAESDALEQRVTTLYVAAADQLGSEKAPVRLAGLYALERLGQDNPKLRQTVFDVWCAYLRMPYTPPTDVLRRETRSSPRLTEPEEEALESERRQELEVRLTAQRLLTTHLRGHPEEGSATYWLNYEGRQLEVDLVGATLVNFSAGKCSMGYADFSEAQFYGATNLDGTQFHAAAGFPRAVFHSDAFLRQVGFNGVADFQDAQFRGRVYLNGSKFWGVTGMDRATFHDRSDLSTTEFKGFVSLSEAVFAGGNSMRKARFLDEAYMIGTQFQGDADFREVSFSRDIDLLMTFFAKSVDLTDAGVTPGTRLPKGWETSNVVPISGALRSVFYAGGESG
jgi:uncharacterized protein YjbI with pentapeptide repeats